MTEIAKKFLRLCRKLGRIPTNKEARQHGFSSSYYFQKLAPLAMEKSYKKRDPKTELLQYLVKLSRKLGRTASGNDLLSYGVYNYTSYIYHFGSFTNAQKLAGLKPNTRGHQQEYTDEQLLDELRRLAKKLGRIPKYVDVDRHGICASNTMAHRFGSLKKAQVKAGLKVKTKK